MELQKIKFEVRHLLVLMVLAVLGFGVLGKYLGIFVLPESTMLLCGLIIMFYCIIELLLRLCIIFQVLPG